MMRKKMELGTLVFAIIALLLFQGTVSAAPVKTFTDVSDKNWAGEAIQSMAERNIISGNPDGTFHPNDPVTREQFAKLIALTFGLDLTAQDTPTFSDVQPNTWSYVYVEAAKEYMTGYFPPNGKAFFDPRAKASREDVAVALVRALNLSSDSIDGDSIVNARFNDADEVSPQLMNDVAIAVQNKLISGFPDGTFRPQDPIDRASVASLLYRVLKTSYKDATKDVELKVNLPEKSSTSTVQVKGTVTKGAKLYINDQEIEVTNGNFSDALYLDKGEGPYEFTFKAVLSNGRSRSVTQKVVYELTGPKLTVTAPATSNKPTAKISGKLTDASDSNPTLTINDEEIYVSYDGSWSKEVKLNEGKNAFTIKAVNRSEKQTEVIKEIVYTPGIPELTLGNIPETTTSKTITFSGRATDANDSNPKVYINDQYVDYSNFSKSFTLKEGENVFTFKAVNSSGKSSEVITKTVIFKVDGPQLTLDNIPESVSTKTITVSGRATDANDSNPKVYINDQYVDYSNFSKSYTLKEVDNVFTFKAVNNLGKTSEVITKTVKFIIGGPTLTLDNIPETTNSKMITLSGRATDGNDSSPKVYINDQYVDYSNFSKSYTLKEGDNVFTFKAVNSLGKTSEVITKKVIFTIPGPDLRVDFTPDSTTLSTITLSGRSSDANDSNPKIYINDQYVDYSNFSKTFTLQDGENVFVIKSINSFGKTSEVVTRTIVYNKPQ